MSKIIVVQKTKNNGHFGAKLTVNLDTAHFAQRSFWYFVTIILVAIHSTRYEMLDLIR